MFSAVCLVYYQNHCKFYNSEYASTWENLCQGLLGTCFTWLQWYTNSFM